MVLFLFFFFKQKTAYEMRISDWSQTCALPISYVKAADVVRLIVIDCINVVCAGEAVQTDIGLSHFIDVDHPFFRPDQSPRVKFLPAKDNNIVFSYARLSDSTIRAPKLLSYTRSEERRVGKETVSTSRSRC